MRPKSVTLTLPTVSTTTIATAAAYGAASNLTLDGTTSFTNAIQVGFTSAGNLSARTFTITGTDEQGVAQTEAVTGPNANTVTSTKFFKTITTIAVDASTAGITVSVGPCNAATTGGVCSQWIPLNVTAQNFAVTVAANIAGTINYKLQKCYEDVLGGATPNWTDDATMTNKTADSVVGLTVHATAIRVVVNTYATGATMTFEVLQGRGD